MPHLSNMTGHLEQRRNIALAKLLTWLLVVGVLVVLFAVDSANVRIVVVLVAVGVLGGTWREAFR